MIDVVVVVVVADRERARARCPYIGRSEINWIVLRNVKLNDD